MGVTCGALPFSSWKGPGAAHGNERLLSATLGLQVGAGTPSTVERASLPSSTQSAYITKEQ